MRAHVTEVAAAVAAAERGAVAFASILLWLSALVLCAFVFLGGFSIGLFFLPAGTFALASSVAATRHARALSRAGA